MLVIIVETSVKISQFLSADVDSVTMTMYLEAVEESAVVTASWCNNTYLGRLDRHLLLVTGMSSHRLALFQLRRLELRRGVSSWFGDYWLPDTVERVVSLVLAEEDWGEELSWLTLSEGEREVLREREKALEREELRELRLSREFWAESQMASPWEPFEWVEEESWD